MIAFQWRPPWKELVAATCKHSRSIIKGKAPENCICLQPPARSASTWTQVAFAACGGTDASTSTSTSTSALTAPDVDFLFFYPSFHFNIPRSQNRHLKHVKRALRTIGLSRSMLPSNSNSHPRFSGRKPPPYRHVSHSSTVLSNIPIVEEPAREPPPALNSVPYRKNRLRKDDRTEQDPSKEQPYYPQTTVQPRDPALDADDRSFSPKYVNAMPSKEISKQAQLQLTFPQLLERVSQMISSGGELKRVRWRLFALLRLTDRHFSSLDVDEKALRLKVLEVCKSHMSTNDIPRLEAIVYRTEKLKEHHHKLATNFQIYYSLLIAYCRALRVEDARELLAKLRFYNIRPDSHCYLALVTMYAHLKDPENAQEMVEAMDRDNIPITQRVYASLMNAYVEAGFWDDAIQVFEFLDSHAENHALKPDTYTCTTLMKCYVLMGASLDEVMHIFNLMQRRGLEPRKKTYALVLHAACDAGALDFAEEVFARLDDEVDRKNINVVAFTIMIRGMIRAGKQDVANEYYREMRRRGIEPTSVTWSVLMQAYANAGKPEDNAMLADLLSNFLESHIDTKTGRVRPRKYTEDRSVTRGTATENVYGPVISAIAKGAHIPRASTPRSSQKEANVKSAQAAVDMFSQMLSHPGSKPSLHLYTALLDAYRRVDNVEGVQKLWPHIVAYARQLAGATSVLSEDKQAAGDAVPPSRRNILCLPLSIYIESMSSQHYHREVAEAWQELQGLGFGFDVGNWNHLISAFIRAGETDRAFWIAEELLKDGQTAGNENKKADGEDHPGLEENSSTVEQGELTIDSKIEGDKAETPMRPPNRTWQYHQDEKLRVHAQQSDLILSGSVARQEILRTDPDSAPPRLKEQPSSATPTNPANAASSMTASFATLRQDHRSQVWTLFASTVRMLEDALRRESAGDAAQRGDGQKDNRQELDGIDQSRAELFPRTMKAIENYRIKMRLPTR